MTTKKKMKKKSHKLLLIDYDNLSPNEMVATIGEITNKLHVIFRKHIGLENSISPVEIFEGVMGFDPIEMSIYKREYWWNIIKKVIKQLKSSEQLFIIHRGQKWFVLKSPEEASQYKNQMIQCANALIGSSKKADKWVRKKSWKHI